MSINNLGGYISLFNESTGSFNNFQLQTGATAGDILRCVDSSGDAEWATLLGTTNQINVTNVSGSITLSTPQDINLTSNPTFASITLTTGAASNYVLTSNSSGLGVWTSLASLGVTSLTGTANQVLVNSTSGIAQTGALTLTLPQSINTSNSPTFVGLTLSGLTASQAVVTDASKNLASLAYSTTPTALNLVERDSNANVFANNFISSVSSNSASGSPINLVANSSRYQITTGTGTQTYKLPNATTLTTGASWYFNNNATGNVTINDNSNNAVATILPGGMEYVFCTNTGSPAGTWDAHGLVPSVSDWGTSQLSQQGDIVPSVTNTYNLGSSSLLWTKGWFNNLRITNGASSGAILTSNASGDVSWTTLSSVGVVSVTGTTNQVTCSPTSGAVVVSLPSQVGIASNLTVGSTTPAANIGINYQGTITSTSSPAGYNMNGTFNCNTTSIVTGFNLAPTLTVPSGQTWTTYYGMKINSLSGGGLGTLTTAYGLYVENPIIGTTKQAAQFNGDVGISILSSNALTYSNSSSLLKSASLSANFASFSGTLDTVQGIQTSSSPTFTGLTLSGLSTNTLIYSNSSKALASASLSSNFASFSGTLDLASTITLSGLSTNTLVYSNGSKALTSASLSSNFASFSGTLDTIQGIQTSSSPQFAKLGLGSSASYPLYVNVTQSSVDRIVEVSGTNNFAGSLYGLFVDTSLKPNSTASNAFMQYIYPNINNGTTNVVTNAAGLFIDGGSFSYSSNAYGLWVNTPNKTSNVTNAYCAYFTGNVGIGVQPVASSLLTIDGSTNKGFLPPTNSSPSANITSPANGLQCYNTLYNMPAFANQNGKWIGMSGLCLLSATSYSSVASVSFNSSDALPLSQFSTWVLVFQNLLPVTNSVNFQIQLSNDGGSTYKSSGYTGGCTVNPAGTNNTWSNTNSTSAVIFGPLPNSGAAHLTMTMGNLNQTNPQFYGSGSQGASWGLVNANQSANGFTGFKLSFSSGNISTMTVLIYGLLGS